MDTMEWQEVEIASLKVHPMQAKFPEPLSRELEELTDDLQRNGQRTPIEIVGDGTVVRGHQLLVAARALQWTKIRIRVRRDLDSKPDDITRAVIEDNHSLSRPLDFLRAQQALMVVGRSGFPHDALVELRNQFCKRFNDSTRTFNRLRRILRETPVEVQRGVAGRQLTIALAEAVAKMPRDVRHQIAEEIRAGGEPRKVVNKYLPSAPPQAKEKQVRKLLDSIERANGRLASLLATKGMRLTRIERELLRRLDSAFTAYRKAGHKKPGVAFASVLEAFSSQRD